MLLRRFNENGIAEFREYLQDCRASPHAPPPYQLLANASLTTTVEPNIEVIEQEFLRRRDAAEYLQGVLDPLSENEVRLDGGLWTWLTLYYFDQVCPPREGRRTVKNDYHYIFEPTNQRHFYRHLLFLAWRIIVAAPQHNRLFLDVPLSTLDKASTEVMKRLYITRIKCVFEALDRIYFDADRGRIRVGLVSPGKIAPGDLINRFPIRIRQLEMTFDLQSLSADHLIELLGDEFKFDQRSSNA